MTERGERVREYEEGGQRGGDAISLAQKNDLEAFSELFC